MSILLAALAAFTSPAGSAAECAPLPGIEALVSRPDLRFLLIGEYHGTAEMPAVAGDALCAAVATGRPVILGIEFAPENQAHLDAYIVSDGGAAARAALLQAPAWREEGGRATSAVLGLVERARRFARTHAVTAVAFDRIPLPTLSAEREAGLAAGLANAQMRVPGSLVVALTGLGHADKEGWISQTPPFLAAGGLLPAAHTVSLAFARPGDAIGAATRRMATGQAAAPPMTCRRASPWCRAAFASTRACAAASTVSTRPAPPIPRPPPRSLDRGPKRPDWRRSARFPG